MATTDDPYAAAQQRADTLQQTAGGMIGQFSTPPTHTFTPRAVDPNELSQNQLDSILRGTSPLMQRARAEGTMLANRRGLLNSSIAAGAAQNAMIDKAQPFALQDASTVHDVLTRNEEMQDQAGRFNVQNKMDMQKLNLAQQFDLQKLGADYGLRNAQLQIQNDIAKEQTALSQGNELQKSYVSQTNALMNNYLNGWFKVQESTMTPEQKTAALNEYNTTIRTWQTVLNTAYASLPEWREEWGMSFA